MRQVSTGMEGRCGKGIAGGGVARSDASRRGINQTVVGFAVDAGSWSHSGAGRSGQAVEVHMHEEGLPPEEQAFLQQLRERPANEAEVVVECLRVIEGVVARRLLVQLASGYVVPDWWGMAVAVDILANGAAAMGNAMMVALFEEDRLLAVTSIEMLAAAGLLG